MRLKNSGIISAANSLFTDLMFAGVFLPQSLVGRITTATLTAIANELMQSSINGNGLDIEGVLKKNITNLTPDEISILKPIVGHILDVISNAVPSDDCTVLTTGYETPQDNRSVQLKINCIFSVCAKWAFQSLMWVITDWTASGNCVYTCADGAGTPHTCSCKGLKLKGNMNISGSGHGVHYHPCKVNNAK